MEQAINFTGTGVAIVTPFTNKGAVDFTALTKLVDHIIKGRVEYIVVLGTTGETATLSKEEKQQVITHIVKATKKRVPLVLGVGGNNTAEIVEQLKKMIYQLLKRYYRFRLITINHRKKEFINIIKPLQKLVHYQLFYITFLAEQLLILLGIRRFV